MSTTNAALTINSAECTFVNAVVNNLMVVPTTLPFCLSYSRVKIFMNQILARISQCRWEIFVPMDQAELRTPRCPQNKTGSIKTRYGA